MAALLDTLRIKKTAVFAGSGGGPAAYALAARHPSKVASLIQVDAVCLPIRRQALVRILAMDFSIRFQLWLVHHAPGLLLKALLQRFSSRAVPGSRNTVTADVDQVRIANLEAILRASSGWANRKAGFDNDTRELTSLSGLDLQAIRCPVLIMHARADDSVRPENASFAHEQIPNSELFWMEGSHVAFFVEEAHTAPPYALAWLQALPTRDAVTRDPTR
jgi:pimeloyl-ACP methyl ester carboxylesterase